jgi:D-amino-acid dehydrogenase
MRHVTVVGGGVIGVTTAWWLAQAGMYVTLVERGEIAGEASYRNGGQLSYRYVAPLADAGVPAKALQWLFEQDGPLRLRLEADPRQWIWLAQFLYRCNAGANRRTTAQLLGLGELSRTAMAELETALPLHEFGWRDAGKLVVYRKRKTFDSATARPDADDGSPARREILDAAACAAREPALREAQDQLAGGIFNSGEAVADCHAFSTALAQRLAAHPRFVGVVRREVRGFTVERGRVTALRTDDGDLEADTFVLAAGIASRDLAATAGIRLPLYPLKGYSLTAPIGAGHVAPEISVTDFERKVLYARIGDKLRVAAMVDMVGEDASLNHARLASLTRMARSTMPRAADYDRAAPWAGLRPATPSSSPILGATPVDNLWLNVGHGPLGFTFACGSAAVLAALMSGRDAPIPLDGLTLKDWS